MNHKRIYSIITGIILVCQASAQVSALRQTDQKLTASFKAMIYAEDPYLRYDSLAPAFRRLMKEELRNPVTFNNKLDSLSTYISIKTSPDRKVKFYSWDERSGGPWHDIRCLAQFKSSEGIIVVQPLDKNSLDDFTDSVQGTDNDTAEAETFDDNRLERIDFTDSGIYKIFEIMIAGKTAYLTFGWGTHGSGNQHDIVRVFTIHGDTLINCRSCFPGNTDLVIEYPRGDRQSDLAFNPATNEISFKKYMYNNDIGVYRFTGKTTVMKLRNDRFYVLNRK